MTLTLLNSPVKSIPGIESATSDVNAGKSQLPYDFQREDYEVIAITSVNNNATIRLSTNYGDIRGDIANGLPIYISTERPDLLPDGLYDVDNSTFANGSTYIEVVYPLAVAETATTGFFNNLPRRPNYKVAVIVSTPTLAPLTPTFLFSPRPNGYLFIDVGEIVTTLQERALESSKQYILEYREQWDGSLGVWFSAPLVQSIYADVKQNLQIGGSNMFEYLLSAGSADGGGQMPNIPFEELPGTGLLPPSGTTGDVPWVTVQPNLLEGQLILNPGTNGTNDIRLFEAGQLFPDGIKILIEVAGTYEITAFVAGGAFQVELVTGGNVVILRETITDPVGNEQPNIPFSVSKTFSMPSDQTDLLLAFRKVGTADYDANFDVTTLKVFFDAEGEFLTNFEKPFIWEGFKRTVSAVVDSNMSTRIGRDDWQFKTSGFDINKNADLGGGELFPQDSNLIDIATVDISSGFDFSVNPYYVAVEAQTIPNPIFAIISKRLYFEVKCLPNNPIAIEWLNSAGAFDQHIFGITQTFQKDVEQGLTYENAINEDIATQSLTKGRVPLTWVQSFQCEADDLTKDQMKALSEIKQSAVIRIWLKADGTKWVNAVVSNFYSTIYDSDERRFSVNFQFELPNNYDLEKALEYGN